MVRAWLERLLRPEPPTSPTEPPVDVLAAIQSAHIVARAGEKDGARALVMLPGRRGFALYEDKAEGAILAAFPGLNAAQVQRAAQCLLDCARVALRESARAASPAEAGPRWGDWKSVKNTELPNHPAAWHYGE